MPVWTTLTGLVGADCAGAMDDGTDFGAALVPNPRDSLSAHVPAARRTIQVHGWLSTACAQTLVKDKANTYKSNPKVAIFQSYIYTSGGILTLDLQHSGLKLYQLSHQAAPAG